MRTLNPLTRAFAEPYFALARTWYRVRYPRLTVGKGVLFIGRLKLRRRTTLVLGNHVRLRGKVIVNGGGVVEVGSYSLLNGCWILAAERVTIGDRCLISDCGITDSDFHNLEPLMRHEQPTSKTRRPVRIGPNVWVGTHALVLKGTCIGEDSVVAAGAVVRSNVPARTIAAGNPAQIVRSFDSSTV